MSWQMFFFSFFYLKVQFHVWVGKTTMLGLGEEMEVAGLRGSEIKPIACSKSRKYRGGRGGGEFDGKRYRKVLLHTAYRT